MMILVGIFSHLSEVRAFERQNLPFLRTVEDFDIVHTIGLKQELGETLLLKQLFLAGIGSIATVGRRVARLRAHSIIMTVPIKNDRRMVALVISPNIHKIYSRYWNLLKAL